MENNYEGLNFEGFAHRKTAELIKQKYNKVYEDTEDPRYQEVYNIVTTMIYAVQGWFETSTRSFDIKPINLKK